MSTAEPSLAPGQKWPNVPACYGRLSLDRRGNWRLQGERVSHPGLIAFINQNYGCDAAGNWFMQNGPQRVFVELGYTPWIYHFEQEQLLTHTQLPAGTVDAVFLDESGNILLHTPQGLGLLDDRDLPQFLEQCTDASARPVDAEAFEAFLAGQPVSVFWQGMALQGILAANLAKRFKFNPTPQSCSGQAQALSSIAVHEDKA